jgi:hypothetical protein
VTSLPVWLNERYDEVEAWARATLDETDLEYLLADLATKRDTVWLHSDPWPAAHRCPAWTERTIDDPRRSVTDWEIDCLTLRLAARPFADQPGFDPSWKVGEE